MGCAHSYELDFVQDWHGNNVKCRCGHCPNCRASAMAIAILRGKEEWSKSSYASFATLTYDDNHLYRKSNDFIPWSGKGLPTFKYSHLSSVLNSLRYELRRSAGSYPPFSWLACFEYGEDFFRPHIHIVVFDVFAPLLHKIFNKVWEFGFNEVDVLRDGGIAYVCKYMQKSVNGLLADALFFDRNVNQPKVCWSSGFGSSLFARNALQIRKTGCIKVGSKFVPVPSYYRRKYQSLNLSDVERVEQFFSDQFEKKNASYRWFGYSSSRAMDYHLSLNKELNFISKERDRLSSIFHSPFVAHSCLPREEIDKLSEVALCLR